MLDISIRDLIRKKLDLEEGIMKIIQAPINQFQKETGVGVRYINIELVSISQCEGTPKYIISNVAVDLDLDFIEALDKTDRFNNPKQLTLFD